MYQERRIEIIGIESDTFEMMKQKFGEITSRIKNFCEKKEQNDWLDNQDVCRLLDISKRTLQSYRDKGVLAYSQVGHKCFYRASDVERLLENLRRTNKN
jgi:hypothetical protein